MCHVSSSQERILDVVEDQIEEMTLRVENVFGSDLFMDCLSYSLEDSEDDVEYLYRADRPSVSSGSGYESDHSTMSAVRWQLSSSSSHCISDESSGPEAHTSPRLNTCTWGGAEMYGLSAQPHHISHGDARIRSDLSYSSCYEMSRSSDSLYPHGDFPHLARWDINCSESHQPGAYDKTNILRDIALRDSDLCDGVLRDNLRDDNLRDRKISVYSTASSDRAASQDLSSSSGNSLPTRAQPEKEPIRPKAMYGRTRAHARKGREAFPNIATLSPRPSTSAQGGNAQAATNNSSDQEAGKRIKRTHSRKGKGLFRSSAVYPCQDGLSLGHSPPLPHSAAHQTNSGYGDSDPSVSSQDHKDIEQPLKGLLGDISMNKRLGTEIRNVDDVIPGCITPGDD